MTRSTRKDTTRAARVTRDGPGGRERSAEHVGRPASAALSGRRQVLVAHVLHQRTVADLEDTVRLLSHAAVVGHDDERRTDLLMISRNKPVHGLVFSVSRFPVGSSASTRAGRFMSARAMATRCFWPPERSLAFFFSSPRGPGARGCPSRAARDPPVPGRRCAQA